ncbi:hypothetical protein [Niveispirillum irakense]|nr:hypothetical protein [Niveispirillum irakense]
MMIQEQHTAQEPISKGLADIVAGINPDLWLGGVVLATLAPWLVRWI